MGGQAPWPRQMQAQERDRAEGGGTLVGRSHLQSLMIPLINLLLTDLPLHREAAGGLMTDESEAGRTGCRAGLQG